MRGIYSLSIKVIMLHSVDMIVAPPVISVPESGKIASDDAASFASPIVAPP